MNVDVYNLNTMLIFDEKFYFEMTYISQWQLKNHDKMYKAVSG